MEKYVKIKHFGDDENKELLSDPDDLLVVEEKMDGANFRFMITKEGAFVFGSKNNEFPDAGGNWKRCIAFIRKQTEGVDLKEFRGCVFFGECMVSHSLPYNWEVVPPYLGFDVLVLHDDLRMKAGYATYEVKKQLFDALHLPLVPLVWKGCVNELSFKIDASSVPESKYYSLSSKDKLAEGLVFKNYSTGIFAKIVRDEFKEINREAFGGGKKFGKDDTERIVAVYCTNARIEKQLFALIHEGHKLEMPLMHVLPRLVTKDIWSEHWSEISEGNWELNLKSLRSQISKRCFVLLKQVIINSALQKEVL